uniref:C2H2-type domain-containing protein n=1 Tax=Glossina pallidipes TaxID=7398 RepID=A0A1B0A646_GLOPL
MDMVEVLSNIGETPVYEKTIMSLKDFPKDKRLRFLENIHHYCAKISKSVITATTATKKKENGKFSYDFCGRTYKQKCSLNGRLRMHHEFHCLRCEVKFSTLNDFVEHQHLVNHIRKKEEKDVYGDKCEIRVKKEMWPHHLRTNFHKDNWNKWMDMSATWVESTFQNRIEIYKWENRNKENLIFHYHRE